jgi:DMSO/TMAO reductase YedYZ molybdopterin-dependent catalytic subunit
VSSALSRRQLLIGAAGALSAEQPDVTQADQFFVRDHFEEPDLSLATWKLRIEGNVAHPLELSISHLLESPATQQESLLECAGNGESGAAVSMGIWQGVPMFTLLKMAGTDATGDVLLEGAEGYLRIVPGKKCRAPESLIAIKLNGRFLPRRNGFPARVILPGWYGMDSVKWLQRITVFFVSARRRLYWHHLGGRHGNAGMRRTRKLSDCQQRANGMVRRSLGAPVRVMWSRVDFFEASICVDSVLEMASKASQKRSINA